MSNFHKSTSTSATSTSLTPGTSTQDFGKAYQNGVPVVKSHQIIASTVARLGKVITTYYEWSSRIEAQHPCSKNRLQCFSRRLAVNPLHRQRHCEAFRHHCLSGLLGLLLLLHHYTQKPSCELQCHNVDTSQAQSHPTLIGRRLKVERRPWTLGAKILLSTWHSGTSCTVHHYCLCLEGLGHSGTTWECLRMINRRALISLSG